MKNTRQILFTAIAVLLLFNLYIPAAYANGGPGEGHPYTLGGNISFTDTPDITVEREDLSITLAPRTAVVRVEYVLKNHGPARELNYVFPITQYIHDYYNYSGENEGVEWVNFYDGENKLAYTRLQKQEGKADESDFKETKIGSAEVEYNYITNSYYETRLSFAAGEEKRLIVAYSVYHGFTSWGTSKSLLSSYSTAHSYYDFSPAAAWGNGKAGEFNLTIDYTALPHARDISVSLGDFKRNSGGVYSYQARNFDFKQAGLLEIAIDYPYEYEYLSSCVRSNDHLELLYVSSTLPGADNRYSAHNLFDGDLQTAWASKGNGEGVQLQFTVDRAHGVWLAIVNGYVKSEETYYDNARVKKLLINGREMEFPDTPYAEINLENPFYTVEIGWRSMNFDITVLETYPGRKYQDLCISEMYLLVEGWEYDHDIKAKAYRLVEEPIAEILAEREQAAMYPGSSSQTEITESTPESLMPPLNTRVIEPQTQQETAQEEQPQQQAQQESTMPVLYPAVWLGLLAAVVLGICLLRLWQRREK